MPLFTIDIQKVQGTEYWTNRYVVNDTSLGTASVSAEVIANREIQFHSKNLRYDRIRIRPLAAGGDNYIILPFAFDGGYDGGDIGSQIPLFNVVRVDMAVSEGRPSRKYFRTGLTESMVIGSTVEEVYRQFVDTQMELMRTNLGGKLVDVDGQGINSMTVFPAVGMRQLRRGSRRRLQPII